MWEGDDFFFFSLIVAFANAAIGLLLKKNYLV